MAQPISAQPIPSPQEAAISPPRAWSAIPVAAAVLGLALGAALVIGALVLWVHYGTTVFFEMIASGIAACF